MSPDPAGMAAVDPTNPQSWNRYTYVLNNPLALIDPLGEQCFYYLVWDDGWHQVSADGFCGPSGGGGGPPSDGGGNSAGGGGKLQQPQKQQPRKPKPWFCGTGNSWSHPFTAPTSRQWGIWAASDAIVSSSIAKFTKGTDPFSQAFYWSALLEGYGWAACGD
jgi:hypothetical protein